MKRLLVLSLLTCACLAGDVNTNTQPLVIHPEHYDVIFTYGPIVKPTDNFDWFTNTDSAARNHLRDMDNVWLTNATNIYLKSKYEPIIHGKTNGMWLITFKP